MEQMFRNNKYLGVCFIIFLLKMKSLELEKIYIIVLLMETELSHFPEITPLQTC